VTQLDDLQAYVNDELPRRAVVLTFDDLGVTGDPNTGIHATLDAAPKKTFWLDETGPNKLWFKLSAGTTTWVEVYPGSGGGAGGALAGETWELDTTTADADPGAGKFRFNAVQAAATFIYLDDSSDNGSQAGANTMATLAPDDQIYVEQQGDDTRYERYVLTGIPTIASGYIKIPVQVEDGTGAFIVNGAKTSFRVFKGTGGLAATDIKTGNYTALDGERVMVQGNSGQVITAPGSPTTGSRFAVSYVPSSSGIGATRRRVEIVTQGGVDFSGLGQDTTYTYGGDLEFEYSAGLAEWVLVSGKPMLAGDTHECEFHFQFQTVNATPVLPVRWDTLGNGRTTKFWVEVVGKRFGGPGARYAHFLIHATFDHHSLGPPPGEELVHYLQRDIAVGMSVDVDFVISSNEIQLRVTGLAGEDVDWIVRGHLSDSPAPNEVA